MLTFSEALTELKKGEAVRWHEWPASQYVIVSPDYLTSEFVPTQAQMLGAQWEMA